MVEILFMFYFYILNLHFCEITIKIIVVSITEIIYDLRNKGKNGQDLEDLVRRGCIITEYRVPYMEPLGIYDLCKQTPGNRIPALFAKSSRDSVMAMQNICLPPQGAHFIGLDTEFQTPPFYALKSPVFMG